MTSAVHGWLYFSDTLPDYMGQGMSDAELRYLANDLALMQEYIESQGKQFAFTIAPNKNSIYPSICRTILRTGTASQTLPA